jgi:uncharacterized lipoprotein YbaY
VSAELITGSIEFPKGVVLPPEARVQVRLVDVTAQDDFSRVVGETVLENISQQVNSDGRLTYRISAKPPAEECDYAIQVHVDTRGQGFDRFHAGDFIHARRFPAPIRGHPARATIHLQRV